MQRQILSKSISDLRPNSRNSRTHSKRQLQQLQECIQRFGFINPVLIDNSDRIIAGHGRVLAAKSLGLQKVPVLIVSHLSADELRLLAIADNKIAENAGWDKDILRMELAELADSIAIDLRITGFEAAEIDLLISVSADDENEADSSVSLEEEPVTIAGDLWEIGPHRLICGDARNLETYTRLMDGQLARQIFSDPPYNVPIRGHVSGLGKNKHPEFAMASGELSPDEFVSFLRDSFQLFARHSADGSLHYLCMDWRHISEIMQAGISTYSEFKNLCVWAKTNAGMGSFYRSQHELVFIFKHGRASHINNIELGRFGRNRSNIWSYPGMTSFGRDRESELSTHPTVKPVTLVADAIADGSNRGDIILDGFCGSGTTLAAAHKMGRRGFGIEMSPHYVDVAINRLEMFSGLKARNVRVGATFAELIGQRVREAAA